ncbi:MAG: tetratricopeptide repeat protein [Spirochaetia bacterium]|jgi:hypothetical protein|nr:tetratricopeptide repeat protein [Spirochaetia bacterium]
MSNSEKNDASADYFPVDTAALELDYINPETAADRLKADLPEVISPFIHIHVPLVNLSLSKDHQLPPYTLPSAPKLPEKAAALLQPVKSADIAAESPPAFVPLSKIPKNPAHSKTADNFPAVKGASSSAPAPAPAPAQLIKKDVSKDQAAKTVPKETVTKEVLQKEVLPKEAAKKSSLSSASPVLPPPAAKSETVYYTYPGVIEILLDRQGWIYAGEKEGKKSVVFESKDNLPGNPGSTLFRFTVKDEGPYKLIFQLQDRSGKTEISELDIKQGTGEKLNPENGTPDIDTSSISTLLSASQQSQGSVLDGKQVTAEKNEITEKIIEAALLHASEKNYEKAIEMLEIITRDYPDFTQMDRVYYLLGQYYEADSTKRNASKAVQYYEKLIDEFPLSSNINEAELRVKYLEKYFIHIR